MKQTIRICDRYRSVRRYKCRDAKLRIHEAGIHYIHMNGDPAGTMRENLRLRQENTALRRADEMLAAVKPQA